MPESSSEQIVDEGGYSSPEGVSSEEYWYEETDSQGSVAVSKVVTPTEHENYFDITLEVKATPTPEDNSVAVVLVMDTSNTMNAPVEGSDDTRLDIAKEAASKFISDLCTAIGMDPNRQVGLVSFNTDATAVTAGLLGAVSEADAAALQALLNGLTAPGGASHDRFTNIEGGLLLASNLLDSSSASNKYIVLLTDGFPTTYVVRTEDGNAESLTEIEGYDPYMDPLVTYDPARNGEDGYFANADEEKVCTYGTSYSDTAAEYAEDVAKDIKDSGTNIFSVGVDVSGQTIEEYLDPSDSFTVVEKRTEGSEYVIGDASDTDSYKAWLGGKIAGGPALSHEGAAVYADGDDLEALDKAYANIFADIMLSQRLGYEVMLTTDPMGQDVEFLYFLDRDGNPVDALTGEPLVGGENEAWFVPAAAGEDGFGTLYWDKMKSGYTITVDENGVPTYVFTLKYRVRLANESPEFAFGEPCPTNDGATVEFVAPDPDGGVDSRVVEYPDPEVVGFEGSLEFTKLAVYGDESAPLEGAAFELVHDPATCEICCAAGCAVEIDPMMAWSDEDGLVAFHGIPSGHDYVLIEVSAPEGIVPADGTSDTYVTYGVTRVSVAADGLLEGFDPDADVAADGSVVAGEGLYVVNVGPPPPPDTPEDPGTPPGMPQTGDSTMAVVALLLCLVALLSLSVCVTAFRCR